MRKYIILFLQHLSEYSTYRMRLLVTILQGFVTPLFLLIVLSWARPISSVSVSDLLPYYLLVGLIYPLTRSRIDEFIDESATSGEVNNFLVKPLSFYKFMLTSDLSWKTLNLITLFPFIRGQFSSSEIPISLFWLALIGLAVVFFQKLAIRRYSHTAG